ncbi:aldo/keto reductase [Aggregatimonas sangjinii]|uniref:Aldo/keto reductase n=1 Tax=Aggregatimonas sangjinii TaxID=2583587 RepID=A0A5B7SYE4_9FLAO|nr:aldo/keto reductase [Aggregatimonas sangjinii]QCX01814.1 aldo/keto reductase [Aggregatimonas sangjinii]
MKQITNLGGGFTLRNGVQMPYLGLGTYMADNENEVSDAVRHALNMGYRHIDTASIYKNEEGVGKGIRESDVARSELFVVSKVWNADQGYEETLRAFEQSLDRLQLDYLDLYLIHWPVTEKYKETWRAMEKLYAEKLIRAIGVSNFLEHHLEDLMGASEVAPMVNQMEFHPFLVQQELIDYCSTHGIQYEAWSPFMQGKLFEIDFCDPLVEKYNKTAAQLILRYNLQKGVVTIPKSVNKERIRSNADIFDFELADTDIKYLDSLDRGERTGPDPDNFDF